MSPASQGNLEVERFIGTNLISSWARVNVPRSNGKGRKPDGKQRPGPNVEQYGRHGARNGYPNSGPPCDCTGAYAVQQRTWTGVPLITGKKKNPQYPRNALTSEDEASLRTPLSRLAIHTQGAPLILAGRCGAPRKIQNRGPQPRGNRNELGARRSNKYKDSHPHGLNGTSDCLSVASDESSGSSHSENCLPRIIKPRKRRKKDRKPVPGAEATNGKEDGKAGEPSSTDSKPNQESKITTGSHSDDVSEDDLHCPKLHHSFEDVAESEPCAYPASSCQCHYCDPSGIWDAGSFPDGSVASFLTPPPESSAKSFQYETHPDLVLRRSWSEPIQAQAWNAVQAVSTPQRSNSFSLAEDFKSRNWGDTHRWNASGGRFAEKGSGNYGSQCLEVSTEIVTSPNGHRDLEIRFYSTSPPS